MKDNTKKVQTTLTGKAAELYDKVPRNKKQIFLEDAIIHLAKIKEKRELYFAENNTSKKVKKNVDPKNKESAKKALSTDWGAKN